MWFEQLLKKNIIISYLLMESLCKLPKCNNIQVVSNHMSRDERDKRGIAVREIIPRKVVAFFILS